ncbi:MAG: single-stranded DNA-binding protein [Nitrospinae bacterium CG11_big_fil_rev_8_21_14_0_20_56_8]|nr:MAG: single-stranded DNA-binding protein [Nitrospinae bacterium CG11_big_fil_rev_8_21_14_0_20_56_8]
MANFNKVLLMGNLTRDPELRYTASGAAVATFGMAINRRYKQGDEWKEDVCFVDITVWGKQGENCAEYLSKGRPVFVDGYLRFTTWETDNGQKRSKLDVTANTVQFLGGRGDAPRGGSTEPMGEEPPFPAGKEDDIPF